MRSKNGAEGGFWTTTDHNLTLKAKLRPRSDMVILIAMYTLAVWFFPAVLAELPETDPDHLDGQLM